ncbi:MAG: helix-turn-helix domain-containing protein [Gammaproteobacteria bacterium]|nr:helix-turn-helix domain-containing protein [Gammaproteobacteria bacterium]
MKKFPERLIACREAAGLSQSELARRLSVSPQAVQKWESAQNVPRGKRLELLASILSTTVSHLMVGDLSGNIEHGPSIKGRLPLISWVQAGEWTEIADVFDPSEAEDWLHCPVAHSPRAFVLRVRGESMLDPRGKRSFKDGDLIFVDPERPAGHGSLVIAKLTGGREATFKELVIEGDNHFLKALNPDWPERIFQINSNCHIAGVVIGKYEPM